MVLKHTPLIPRTPRSWCPFLEGESTRKSLQSTANKSTHHNFVAQTADILFSSCRIVSMIRPTAVLPVLQNGLHYRPQIRSHVQHIRTTANRNYPLADATIENLMAGVDIRTVQ